MDEDDAVWLVEPRVFWASLGDSGRDWSKCTDADFKVWSITGGLPVVPGLGSGSKCLKAKKCTNHSDEDYKEGG